MTQSRPMVAFLSMIAFSITVPSPIPGASGPSTRARRDGLYVKTVRLAIRHPGITILLSIVLLIGVPYAYFAGGLGKGVEFFPNVEPDVGLVLVHARGNLSLAEKDRLVRSFSRKGEGPAAR